MQTLDTETLKPAQAADLQKEAEYNPANTQASHAEVLDRSLSPETPARSAQGSPDCSKRNLAARRTGLPPSGSHLKRAQLRQAQQRFRTQQRVRSAMLKAQQLSFSGRGLRITVVHVSTDNKTSSDKQARVAALEGQGRQLAAQNVLLQAVADNALMSAPSEVETCIVHTNS